MKKQDEFTDLFKYDPEVIKTMDVFSKSKDIHVRSLISMGRIHTGSIFNSDSKEARLNNDSSSSTKIYKCK